MNGNIDYMSLRSTLDELVCASIDNLDCCDEHNIRTLAKLIDNAEKYRLHDLRKNPEDLPTKDGDYMCIVDATKHPERPMTYAPWDLGIKGGNKWRDFSGYVYDHFVIAWREPFDEVER